MAAHAKEARGNGPVRLDDLPAPERRTKELGFTVTPASHDRIKLAARLAGKRLASYLRDVTEEDATKRVADAVAKEHPALRVAGSASLG